MLAFVHPLFLLGLVGLGVPVILHLMNREIPSPQRFPSIRFILKGRLPQEGRSRLQDLLLLAVRLLLLTALVLTFSRPVWRSPVPLSAGVDGSDEEVLLVADVSASIEGREGVSELQRLLREAVDGRGGADVGLVLSADRPVLAVPPTSDPGPVLEAIEDLRRLHVRGHHALGLKRALQLLRSEKRSTLVVFSDFQQTDWQLPAPPVFGEAVQVKLVDVYPDRSRNVGLTGARVRPLAKSGVQVVAEVRNFGVATETRTVQLRVGSHRASRVVTVAPLQLRRVPFAVPESESERGELTLDTDDYPGDDRYVCWLGDPLPLQLLTVTPLTAEPGKARELFFVKKALEAETEVLRERIVVESVDAEHFFAVSLDSVDALFLLGAVGYFRDEEFGALKEYLLGGGVAIGTPGEAAGHGFRGLRRHRLLAADFLGIAGQHRSRDDPPFGLGWVNPETGVGALFGETGDSDLFTFSLFRYARLKLDDGVNTLIRTTEDDPALLEQPVGKGRLFFSTFAFDPAWGDFPMTTSFVPLVRELLVDARPRGGDICRLECGQEIPPVRTLLGSEGETGQDAELGDTSEPGVFVLSGVPHEVNTSRRESVVEKVSLPLLASRLRGVEATGATDLTTIGASEDETVREHVLWPHFALAVAVLFLLDVLLAWFLDRRDASTPLRRERAA